MRVLGIRIDNLGKKEILKKIEFFLSEEKFHQIATINPEFILTAQKDEDFKNILNQCDLNVADGVGIRFAFLRFGKTLKSRFAGADLLEEILQIANDKKLSAFLAISNKGLSNYDEIKTALEKKYPDINFSGDSIECNPHSTFHVPRSTILFCNFGAPNQERFIKSQKSAKIRLAMGVGGSFDFLTGKITRAPFWMRKFGLEWLWRFFQEPSYRFKRIFQAVIIFPIKILFSKK
jgi:N-acetylglucosaminyldiphosphoundecaprenol N-acetyl-beta-D-mannosaminyltransferase